MKLSWVAGSSNVLPESLTLIMCESCYVKQYSYMCCPVSLTADC